MGTGRNQEEEEPRSASSTGSSEQSLGAQLAALDESMRRTGLKAAALARAVQSPASPGIHPDVSTATDWTYGPADMAMLHVKDQAGVTPEPIPVRVHPPDRCIGRPCCIHHPSRNHMREWPMTWYSHERVMMRTCDHGWAHPDVDHLRYTRQRFGADEADFQAQHVCDGCCKRTFI
jgi:hypothetical protein